MNKKEHIIEMHDTWLVIDAIQGCTNGCKYCFLQETNDNRKKPEILVSPEEAVRLLFSSPYYEKDIPIHLFPGTDAFLTEENSQYTYEILNLLAKANIKNPLILITKCLIPNFILDFLEELTKKGKVIVVYLSYSGLGKKYEPNINPEDTIRNFQELKKRKIKMIHYYRPFFKENAEKQKIKEILAFVDQYTSISVVAGFKVKKGYVDKIEELCGIPEGEKEKCIEATSLWPKEAYHSLFDNKKGSHQIFQTNYCALASLLKKDRSPFFNTYECLSLNHCGEEQQKRCQLQAKKTLENVKKAIIELLEHIDKYDKKIKIEHNENNIIIHDSNLSVSDVAYLTFRLGKKVTLAYRKKSDKRGASSFSNGRPYLY